MNVSLNQHTSNKTKNLHFLLNPFLIKKLRLTSFLFNLNFNFNFFNLHCNFNQLRHKFKALVIGLFKVISIQLNIIILLFRSIVNNVKIFEQESMRDSPRRLVASPALPPLSLKVY